MFLKCYNSRVYMYIQGHDLTVSEQKPCSNLSYNLCLTLRKKCPNTRVFSGPYLPLFGLNTEIYSVNLPIQSEYRKIRTEKTLYFETSRSVNLKCIRTTPFILLLCRYWWLRKIATFLNWHYYWTGAGYTHQLVILNMWMREFLRA